MTEQMTASEKRKLDVDFIKRIDPYHRHKSPYKMDLRGYAKYVSDNNLSYEDITEEIMMKFVTTTLFLKAA